MFRRLKLPIVAGLTTLAFVGAIYHTFATKLNEELALFTERGRLHASMLGRSTDTALDTVEGLRIAAQNILAAPGPPPSRYSSLLEQLPGKNAYGLVGLQPPSRPESNLNLTGLGSSHDVGSLRQEIDAALALEPVFRWVKRVYPETPWVYYLSRERFMCVYPYIPFDQFFMEDAFYDMDLFTRSTPENNADAVPYITDVYVDEAGKGLMVTVGAPVYLEGVFMGIVGFDLTLESLSQSLRIGPLSGDNVYLVNDEAQIIASAGPGPAAETPLDELRPGLYDVARQNSDNKMTFSFSNSRVYAWRLPGVPWMLIAEKSNWDIYRAAAVSTVPLIAFLLIMLAGVVTYLNTKEKQREMESRQSLERFRRLLDSTSDMIAVIDPGSGRLLDGNRAMCEFFELSLEEFRSKHIFDIASPFGSAVQWNEFVAQLADTKEVPVEHRISRFNGDSCTVEVNAHYVKESGQEYVVAILRDISARKKEEAERERLQRRLQQTQKMEAIGQLTSGVAHDFNNILTSLIGFSELARDQAGENEKLKEYLELTLKSGERARQLVRQLLFFSRGDTQKTAGAIALAPHILEIVSMIKPMLSTRIEVRTDLPESSPLIKIDPVHLQQMIMNLSINARDAMPTGGILEIGISERVFNGEECRICHEGVRGSWVCISVRDSGPGISAELFDRIFEPFFTTKETEEGVGMGLSIVQGIVRTYGGHVLVESDPELGSRFDILFAAVAGPVTETAPPPNHGEELRIAGRHILVVDDEPIIRLFFEEVLSRVKAQVTTCANVAEALLVFSEVPSKFDLVITDQTMPGESGIDLIRVIRKLDSQVPVFLHSGYPDAVDPQEVARLKIARVLLKPCAAAELTQAIDDAINS